MPLDPDLDVPPQPDPTRGKFGYWLREVFVVSDDLMHPLPRHAQQLPHLGHPNEVELLRHAVSLLLTYDNYLVSLTHVKGGVPLRPADPGRGGTPLTRTRRCPGRCANTAGAWPAPNKEDADMGKANGRSKTRPIDDPFHFPTGVATWILTNAPLIDALIALRELGPEGDQAVEALLAIRRVSVFRASIELYYALAVTEGLDPNDEMDLVIPAPVFAWLQRGLYGREADNGGLHLV
jgi:hypothetical protein